MTKDQAIERLEHLAEAADKHALEGGGATSTAKASALRRAIVVVQQIAT